MYYHLYFNAFQPGSMMDVRSRTIEDPDRRVLDRILPRRTGLREVTVADGRVRVNGIRPGLIRTELTEAVLMSPEVSADYRDCTPLERIGEVEDIANVALFLLSDAAGYVTGQIINVDGGMQVRRGPDYSAMFEPLFGADALRGVV